MKLQYSTKGTPYIALDDDNKLIFSPNTANKKGYKYLVYTGMSTTTETLSSGKGKTKKRKEVTHTESVSSAINMNFEYKSLSKSAKNANGYMTKTFLESLKKVFKPFVDDEGTFAYSNIDDFAKCINTIDVVSEDDMLEDDPNGYYEDEDDE